MCDKDIHLYELYSQSSIKGVQWNPFIAATLGEQNFGHNIGVAFIEGLFVIDIARGFLMLYVFYITTTPYLPCNNKIINRKELYDFYYTAITLTTGYNVQTVHLGPGFLAVIQR